MISRPVLLAALIALTARAAAQGPPAAAFPDSFRGERLRQWMDCVNEPSAADRTEFLRDGFTEKGGGAVERRQGHVEGMRQQLGTIALDEVLSEEENRIAAVFRGGGERLVKITLTLSQAPPHTIDSVMFEPHNAGPRARPSGTMSDDQIAQELEAFVAERAGQGFSGAVLLSHNGRVLYRQAHGLASRRFGVANTPDTRFNLGSMNKMFTAVAVLQLQQQGLLSLDDPLSRRLDGSWLPEGIADKIKLSHLLSHTSGLGSYFNETFQMASRDRFREVEDYKPLLAGESLAFEPGTEWRYSNTGMLLLGAVIEKVSGMNYFDYVRQHVYQPAGMERTDCYDMDTPVPDLAIGYYQDDGVWKNNLYLHVVRGGPAGGGYSTVDDLHKFSEALFRFELLDPEHTRQLVTPKPNSPAYGYGFQVEATSVGLVVGHGGGFPGIQSKLEVFLDAGFTSVVLSNTDGAASPVVDKIRELVAQAEPPRRPE